MATGTLEKVKLSAYGRLVAFSDEDIKVPVSFLRSTTGYHSRRPGVRNGADAGVAASLALTDNLSAFADYALRVRSGTIINQGAIGIAASWQQWVWPRHLKWGDDRQSSICVELQCLWFERLLGPSELALCN